MFIKPGNYGNWEHISNRKIPANHDNNVPAEFTGRKGAVEIYYSKRYFALTGWKINDKNADVATLNGLTKRLLEK